MNVIHQGRGKRGRLLYRSRVVSIACLYLIVAQLSAACGYQQRPRSAASKPEVKLPARPNVNEPWMATVGDLVGFPSPEVEFIVGPQLKSGSALNPFPWFDRNARDKGIELGKAFPATPVSGNLLAGTVSVVQGSKIVVGAGTHFVSDFPGAANSYYVIITDSKGKPRSHYLTAVQNDTHLTLTAPWQDASSGGRAIAQTTGDAVDAFVNLNYYDQALCQYVNYYRTGDAQFLDYARKITDAWWKAMFIAEGTVHTDSGLAPRNISLAGLMLRALDGRPEMWPWITDYTRTMFDTWVGTRVTYPALYYGVRDGGYMLLHAANLARVHPVEAVRQELKAKVLNAAVNWYARVQYPDGSWRWGAEGSWVGNAMQPYHVGLLLEGMIAVHRLTGDNRLKASITKGAEAIYQVGYNPRGWRASYYQVGGTWADGTNCEKGCGAASARFPPADVSQVAEARQLNTTSIHSLGYAFLLTKDAKFKKWGDEMFDACFSGADGYRALANFRAKEYAESYRSSGRYLAWRLAWGGEATTQRPSAAPDLITASTSVDTPPATTPRELIASALAEALTLSEARSGPSEQQLQALLEPIESAHKAVANRGRNATSADVLRELKAASDHVKAALLIVGSPNGSDEDAKTRIGWAAARLKRASERLRLAAER